LYIIYRERDIAKGKFNQWTDHESPGAGIAQSV